jgi:UDP-MurNAc hydroxylase
MKLTVLSHAGLAVGGAGATLVIDPWLVGSCYWRSWWNYPPVDEKLLQGLTADFIYLTHVHWDHFHGPSLRRFSKETPIYVPKGHYGRIRRDLHKMGFTRVHELKHGERAKLTPTLEIVSYQMFPFLDSALVVECEGVTLLNANDAKFMGGPLNQILANHPKIDFVFRSHSSANGRICFDVIDDPGVPTDDDSAYISSFAAFVKRTGARYAVPFASNHCFLHKEVSALNDTIQTPLKVESHFRQKQITTPELRIMTSGDSWSPEAGFEIKDIKREQLHDRARHIDLYRESNREKLEASYAKEARTKITQEEVARYFKRFTAALPWPVRLYFRKRPIAFILSGREESIFEVDLWRRTVEKRDPKDYHPSAPREVRTSAFIFKQCMASDLFSHIPTSKRVRYRVTKKTIRQIQLLNLLFLMFETELLPVRKMLRLRFVENWVLRWRELGLYARITLDLLMGKRFLQERYL